MNEDVFPIEHGDFPASHVSFVGGVSLVDDFYSTWIHVKTELQEIAEVIIFYIYTHTHTMRTYVFFIFRGNNPHS